MVLKNRILVDTEFQKTGSYMTGRHDCSGPSRREAEIDVWKYLQTIVIGLYAVSEQKFTHPDRELSPTCIRLEPWLVPSGTTRSRQYHESTMF